MEKFGYYISTEDKSGDMDLTINKDLDSIDWRYFLDYEVRSNRFASWVWWEWGKDLMGTYFAWKVRRKYDKYISSKKYEKTIRSRDKTQL